MKLSLAPAALATYIAAQMNHAFPDSNTVTAQALAAGVERALARIDDCFSAIHRKYFFETSDSIFNHLHSDHYAMFLYLLSNEVYRGNGPEWLSSKLFLLNKMLHGVDAFYSIELPKVFLFVHPVGTVLGNARYADFLVVYQNCTVGSMENGIYPKFGEGIILYSKASVIGDCNVGDDVVFGANAFVINSAIPSRSVVTGIFPNLRIEPNRISVRSRKFD